MRSFAISKEDGTFLGYFAGASPEDAVQTMASQSPVPPAASQPSAQSVARQVSLGRHMGFAWGVAGMAFFSAFLLHRLGKDCDRECNKLLSRQGEDCNKLISRAWVEGQAEPEVG